MIIFEFSLLLNLPFVYMGKFCKKCGKIMKYPELSHCSDECIFTDVKNSKSLGGDKGAESWTEESDPWK